ncbi:hypothetical protein [Paraburkholderia sp. BL17N1]|uniref:hypothetical protein n=1 Tax=Paraburkholderia sp. BL17N1 TaxID=1938798 RepID=UPI000EB17A0B|nr:hypothetical protein [Paraburkholderia sp. BL17N1]RKR36245.1 hypothetical protein B0G82_4281 [Paraburkholderia sp. BL17N1]
MADFEEGRWDSVSLSDVSRAWFVTQWKGKYFGNPDFEALVVIEAPRSKCISIALYEPSPKNWQEHEIIKLASGGNFPDFVVTDNQRLVTACTLACFWFHQPASVFLEKPITAMPAISNCIHSLTKLLNDADYQSAKSADEINGRLESWRTDYNRRSNSS